LHKRIINIASNDVLIIYCTAGASKKRQKILEFSDEILRDQPI